MSSNPEALNHITTLMRYFYDQQQIYLRSLNTTLPLFNNESVYFYEGIHPAIMQAQRLCMCIQSWYIPQILKITPQYFDNYRMLQQALHTVNSQIKKINLI